MTRYTTLLGLQLELELTPDLEAFYDRILACPSGEAAEEIAYSLDNPLAPGIVDGPMVAGLPVWTVEQFRDPRWHYLQDAVARCRAACGELDVASVMRAATWSTHEAARSLGVSAEKVRAAARTGDLPAVQVAGQYMLDRRVVEAHASTGTREGKTTRVPALYVRAGTRGEASLVVVAVDDQGRPVEGELRMVEGEGGREVEERVIPEWTEAVIAWGTAGKLRAVRVRPAHGRAVSSFGIDGLEARGRVELLDKTNNRAEASAMLTAFQTEKGGDRA